MATQIQVRRGTTAEWASANPVLADGEPGLDYELDIIKYGDGSTRWASLESSGGSAKYVDHGVVSGSVTLDGSVDSHAMTLSADTNVTLTAAANGRTSAIWAGGSSYVLTVEGELVSTGECIAARVRDEWRVRIIGGDAVVDVEAPGPPGVVTVSPTADGYALTWLAATDDIAVRGYEVQLDGGAWVDSGSNLSHTYTGLAAGSSHSGAVRAYDSAHNVSTSRSWGPTVTLPKSYVEEVQTDNPIHAWHFEGNGTDAEGTLPLTLSGGATYATAVGDGTQALSLPTSTATATAAYQTSMEAVAPFTIEALLRIDLTQPSGANWSIIKNGNAISLNLYNQTQFALASIGVVGAITGTWSAGRKVHVALTWDTANAKVYLNGVLCGTSAKTTAFTGSGSFAIGGDGFVGLVDAAATYGTALTAARLLAHAQAVGL